MGYKLGGRIVARKKREWYPSAEYHVMTRGNRRLDIFRDREDFEEYLKIIFDAKLKSPFKLYGYCLMDNHIHLHIRTIDRPLGEIMRRISALYSRYFNERYNLVGNTFQQRYRAELIATDAYMLQTNRYIHNNPVKAKMVKMPQDYMWSSYQAYIYQTDDHLVDHGEFLQKFKSVEAFIEFTEDGKVYLRDMEIEAIMEDY